MSSSVKVFPGFLFSLRRPATFQPLWSLSIHYWLSFFQPRPHYFCSHMYVFIFITGTHLSRWSCGGIFIFLSSWSLLLVLLLLSFLHLFSFFFSSSPPPPSLSPNSCSSAFFYIFHVFPVFLVSLLFISILTFQIFLISPLPCSFFLLLSSFLSLFPPHLRRPLPTNSSSYSTHHSVRISPLFFLPLLYFIVLFLSLIFTVALTFLLFLNLFSPCSSFCLLTLPCSFRPAPPSP